MSRARKQRRAARRCARPSDGRSISVVIAVQARLDRESLLAMLRTQPDLRVLGTAGALPETLALCLARRPQVVLLSTLLSDPREVPVEAVIRLAVPETRIVAMAPHDADRCALLNPADSTAGDGGRRFPDEHETCVELALAHGAVRAVSRDASPADLFAAVRAAADGPPWAPNGMRLNHSANLLTPQESCVARLVGQADSNKEIATALRISELTVKKHIGHVLHKLGLHDRLQLGLCVARHPLVFREDERLPHRS